MTRRGLFKTLFGGLFAGLAEVGFKTRRGWRCIAEFRCATKPANSDCQVAIFHVREIPDQELLRFKLGLYTQLSGQWKWIDHEQERLVFKECDKQYKRAWDRALKSL